VAKLGRLWSEGIKNLSLFIERLVTRRP